MELVDRLPRDIVGIVCMMVTWPRRLNRWPNGDITWSGPYSEIWAHGDSIVKDGSSVLYSSKLRPRDISQIYPGGEYSVATAPEPRSGFVFWAILVDRGDYAYITTYMGSSAYENLTIDRTFGPLRLLSLRAPHELALRRGDEVVKCRVEMHAQGMQDGYTIWDRVPVPVGTREVHWAEDTLMFIDEDDCVTTVPYPW